MVLLDRVVSAGDGTGMVFIGYHFYPIGSTYAFFLAGLHPLSKVVSSLAQTGTGQAAFCRAPVCRMILFLVAGCSMLSPLCTSWNLGCAAPWELAC